MKKFTLRHLIFMVLCCDLGLFSKRLISPVTNIITDALHIPGGIGTSFSLMFLVIAATIIPIFGCAGIMGLVQSVLALAFGMVGSMGALSPIGYIVPGIIIDCVMLIGRRLRISQKDTMVIANGLASISASLTANIIVFRLRGPVLMLYLCVAATFGVIFGMLGGQVSSRLKPMNTFDKTLNGGA